jgi:hypothetical protein
MFDVWLFEVEVVVGALVGECLFVLLLGVDERLAIKAGAFGWVEQFILHFECQPDGVQQLLVAHA